jgi:hypothetical protein
MRLDRAVPATTIFRPKPMAERMLWRIWEAFAGCAIAAKQPQDGLSYHMQKVVIILLKKYRKIMQ